VSDERDALVTHVFFGATHFLASGPHEWVPERASAALFTRSEARRLADQLGGTVVILAQRRVVDGSLGRSNDRGPRQ